MAHARRVSRSCGSPKSAPMRGRSAPDTVSTCRRLCTVYCVASHNHLAALTDRCRELGKIRTGACKPGRILRIEHSTVAHSDVLLKLLEQSVDAPQRDDTRVFSEARRQSPHAVLSELIAIGISPTPDSNGEIVVICCRRKLQSSATQLALRQPTRVVAR